MRTNVLILFVLFILASCGTGKQETEFRQPPSWAKDAIWYQVFVERFSNGDPANDPTPKTMHAASDFFEIPANWQVSSWTGNWYSEDEWTDELGMDFYARLQLRRYGGDLQGIMNQLDYLSELGVTAIYFNPVNDAPSLHKFDARNYHHIDVNFGPDPEGDLKIIASEDPNDPSTWQWTSADLMFLDLVQALQERGIRVVLDYSWNHTGVEFWAWQDILENQQDSPYSDWYEITSFDDPQTPENEFAYDGWLNLKSLPELRKVDVVGEASHGSWFEGNLNEGAKEHIFAVTQRWLAPDGDVSRGIDGFRLDVADHLPLGFWRDYRKFVRSINPEAYLVGEIWWKDYPDQLMDPTPYVEGDVFDAVMFYQVYRPAKYFFSVSDYEIDAQQLVDSLTFQWDRLRPQTMHAMMNTAATHDTPRLLTCFNNPGMYKYKAKLNENPDYKAGKPDEETYQRAKLYLLHQFTIPGAPHIWNGDEMGMWGADDPDCRKPLWWPDMVFDDETRYPVTASDNAVDPVGFNHELFGFYKQIIAMRKAHPVLTHGDIRFILAEGKKLAYQRSNGQENIYALFNLESEPYTITLEGETQMVNLLNDQQIEGDSVTVEPMTALVVKGM